jgi:hypothetical protein
MNLYRLMIKFLRLLGHVWALPNTVVGAVFGLGGAFRLDRTNRVLVVEGGWMAGIFRRRGFAAMCVGDVVLAPVGLLADKPRIYRHELVHATQARLFGPLYLPLTLAGYALGLLLCPRNPHDGSPLEIWADQASGNGDTNTFLADRAARRSRAQPDA